MFWGHPETMRLRLNTDASKSFFIKSKNHFIRKRKIASTLTFLGGCFAATDI